VPQHEGLIVNVILDPRCMSQMVQHDDQPPFAIVNKVGQPQATLVTIMNFPSSCASCNDGLGMILVFGCLHAIVDQKNCHNVVIFSMEKI